MSSSGKRAYEGYTGLAQDVPPHKRGSATDAVSAHSKVAEQQWMYVDASDKTQGPFALAAMKEWFAQGFLPLGTRVRCSADKEFFTLRECQEIVGCQRAEPRTADQWKVAGNDHMAAGRLVDAIAAYDQAIDRCVNESDRTLRGVLLSNRSGAHLLLGNTVEAVADAQLCVAERPDWAKAHWRLAVALLSMAKDTDWIKNRSCRSRMATDWRRLHDAINAADRAEKLDATASHTETKNAALALLRADAVRKALDASEAEQELEERTTLLKRFRAAEEDTDLRQRNKRVGEQEARDREAAARGLDGMGEAWRKESAAEYAARRARLALLEKIDREAAAARKLGGSVSSLDDEDDRSELEKAEIVDEQLAHSQKHATILKR